MNIDKLQSLVRAVEVDGEEMVETVAHQLGMHGSLALLTMHLRCKLGARPGNAEPTHHIDFQVDAHLRELPAVKRFFRHDLACFYSYEWYCFDNFSAFAVRWHGRLWPTAEHAYQAAKFDDEHIIDRIWSASSAHEAKQIGGSYPAKVRHGWKNTKHDVMEEILRAKLVQHPYVQKKLKESCGKLLVEDSHRDGHWGRGKDWDGENWLGKIWMKIRDEFYPE